MKVAPVSADLLIKLAIGGATVYAVYLVLSKAKDGLDGIGQGIKDAIDSAKNGVSDAIDTVTDAPGQIYDATVGGLNATNDWVNDTGNSITAAMDDNIITRSARTDAYTGKAIFGTLGAATDIASGGYLSRFGEWLGGSAYDLTHSDPKPPVVAARSAYWKS